MCRLSFLQDLQHAMHMLVNYQFTLVFIPNYCNCVASDSGKCVMFACQTCISLF